MCVVKQQPQKSQEQNILQKHLQIDQSIFAPQMILRLWGFFCVGDAGRRGNKITVFSLSRFSAPHLFAPTMQTTCCLPPLL